MSNKLPSQLAVSVVSIPSTQAVRIATANPDRRKLTLQFFGNLAAIGADSSVTLTSGFPRTQLPADFSTSAELWAIADPNLNTPGGSASVQVTEFLDPAVAESAVINTIFVGSTPIMLAPARPTRESLIRVQSGSVFYGQDNTVSSSSSTTFEDLATTTLPVWAVASPSPGNPFPVPVTFIEIYDVED